MTKPRAGVVYMAIAEPPMPGAVKMPQHKGFCLGEKAFCESVGTLTAGEPTTNDIEGALRWPETMEQATQVFIANPLAPQDGRGELTHGT